VFPTKTKASWYLIYVAIQRYEEEVPLMQEVEASMLYYVVLYEM
jgi:hypothetical protein